MKVVMERMGLVMLVLAVGFVWGVSRAWGAFEAYRKHASVLSSVRAQVEQATARLEKRKEILRRARRKPITKPLQEAVLEATNALVKEAEDYGVRVMVSVGEGAQTVDFANAARPMEGVREVLQVPVRIVVPATWESSDRLYAWLRESLLRRQVFIDRVEFSGGVLRLSGRVFGLATFSQGR